MILLLPMMKVMIRRQRMPYLWIMTVRRNPKNKIHQGIFDLDHI